MSPVDIIESECVFLMHSANLCLLIRVFLGEGNGNPLQCSCLENPRDGGAWWAAVFGVAQSQTRLKQLSSSSSSSREWPGKSQIMTVLLE